MGERNEMFEEAPDRLSAPTFDKFLEQEWHQENQENAANNPLENRN